MKIINSYKFKFNIIKKLSLIFIIVYIIFYHISFTISTNSNNFEDLIVLTTNDFHASIEPNFNNEGKQIGGAAMLAGYVNYYKENFKNVSWIIAGDHFQGSPIDTITKGEALIDILNIVKPNVFGLGNHEFDYGEEILLERIKKAEFPIICANLVYENSNKFFTEPFFIEDIGGLKILYIGVITENLKFLVIKENVKNLRILDAKYMIEEIANRFIDEVDLTIVVSHRGLEEDIQLAKELNPNVGVDLIVGGHSGNAEKPIFINGIIIIQLEGCSYRMGKLNLKIDKINNCITQYDWEIITLIENCIKPNFEVYEFVKNQKEKLDEYLQQTIGYLKSPLIIEGDWENNLESSLGNFACDALTDYLNVDIGFQNKGGLRNSITNKEIKIEDIWKVFPFTNYWVKFKLNSNQLWRALERNSCLTGEYIMVPHTIKYVFDSSKPCGERLLEIKFKGQKINPFDKDKYFICATCNFVWDHIEEIFGIKKEEIIANGDFEELKNMIDRELYIEYIKQKKYIDFKIEGRVIDIAKIKDDIPPLIIVYNLNEDDAFTNLDKIKIYGKTYDNETDVKTFSINNIEVILKSDNTFESEITLNEGENLIKFISKDYKDNLTIKEIKIILDKIPPEITLNIPSMVNIEEVTLNGTVKDNLSGIKYLKINNELIKFMSNGDFSYLLNLKEGINEIEIEISDFANNIFKKIYEIRYIKKINLKLKIGSKIMFINDIPKEIDIAPQIIEGRTYLPIRWIVEPLGAKLEWDSLEKKVTIKFKDLVIELWVNKNLAKINNVEILIDPENPKVTPIIKDGRTLLPIRFIAENLGCEVLWDDINKIITIIYPKI